ncbi:MAG: DMT family transporter, partial [Clostridiales bacterium]
MNQTTKGIGIALIGSACFGLAGPLAKMIYAYGVTPSFMLAVRFGIAAIVLWLYVAVNRQKIDFHMDRHQLLLLFFLGAICNVVGTATYFVALETVPVSLGIMIFYTYPFVVNLLTVMIYHHKIALLQKLALAAAFGGLLLMLSLGNKAPSLPGVLLCFVSGLSSCVYVLLLERPRIQGLPVVLMTAVVNSFSSLSFWVYCAVAGQVEFALPGMAWLYLALLAL